MTVLETINLSKHYGEGNTMVKALSDVNMTVNKGEFVAIVGASGSGKTTLLNMLGGLDTPTKGMIFYGNTDIARLDDEDLTIFRREKIGFVFQYYNLLPMLTVRENICLPVEIGKKTVDQEQFWEIVQMLGIENKINTFPRNLSGGQQQRVAIARALLSKPQVILADEPTGNLDRKTSNEVMDLFQRSSKKYEQTMIMITHNTEIAEMADRIIRIEDGKLV